jgi:23S rRNA (cytosine1962-C5)-methyltransferase
MNEIILQAGKERSLFRRHPWIFEGSIAHIEGRIRPGDTVTIVADDGRRLARAAWSPKSQIRARVWTFDEGEAVDRDFFVRRVRSALSLRSGLRLADDTDALRLIHGESDGLPGLIADRYGDVVVLQCLSAGVEHFLDVIVDVLAQETGCGALYERSDADVRKLEGLPERSGLLWGTLPSATLDIREYGHVFGVRVDTGHKTGFYLDQRANRHLVGRLCAQKDVLNCFCYTGGFSIHAAAAGARAIVSVDTSREALALARDNAARNGFDDGLFEWVEADVFALLRRFRNEGRRFDAVILDPPKFAPTPATAEKAARGYKDINLLAMGLLRQGGILATFSCSGGIDAELFSKIVAGAALDAGADMRTVARLSQGPDHPVSVHFPEGAYLKGLICVKAG